MSSLLEDVAKSFMMILSRAGSRWIAGAFVMRLPVIIAAIAVTVASGCGSRPPAQVIDALADTASAPDNDCAVMGAIAREHYGATRDDPPTRVTLDGEEQGERWMAECDWQALGVNYVLDEGPTTPPDLLSMPHVSFRKPDYRGGGAAVMTSLVAGPLAGAGYTCIMSSGVGGWTVTECKREWMS